MVHLAKGLSFIFLVLSASAVSTSDRIRVLGPQGINLWNLRKAHDASSLSSSSRFSREPSAFLVQDSEGQQTPLATPQFRARYFEQPLDHFSKDNKHVFHQRYWVNDRHYKAGIRGPVIVLDGGETSGEVR